MPRPVYVPAEKGELLAWHVGGTITSRRSSRTAPCLTEQWGSAAGVVYNRSGPLLLPELRARSHPATMSPGATGQGVLLARSGDPDYDLSCTPICRWGDYSRARRLDSQIAGLVGAWRSEETP